MILNCHHYIITIIIQTVKVTAIRIIIIVTIIVIVIIIILDHFSILFISFILTELTAIYLEKGFGKKHQARCTTQLYLLKANPMTGNTTNLMTRHSIICAVPCEAPAFFGLILYLSSYHSYSDSWSVKREELPLCMEFLESSPTCQNSHNPNHLSRKRGWDVAVIVNCASGNCTGLAKQFCQIMGGRQVPFSKGVSSVD